MIFTFVNRYIALLWLSMMLVVSSFGTTAAQTKLSDSLKDVVIISSKPLIEHKVDRTIFNVDASIVAIGANGLEVLKKVPGIQVMGNTISITGKSTVKILFNDRLLQLSGDDLTNFLRSLSADDISRIEVITNPPAGYDAEGNTGLINIITKKNTKNGLNGNVRATYAQGIYATEDIGASLNYKKGAFNLYSSVLASIGVNGATEDMVIYYPTQTWRKHNTRGVSAENISGTLGVDYKLTTRSTIGFIYNGGYNEPDFSGHITNPIYNNYSTLDSVIRTETHTQQSTSRHAVNLDWLTFFDTAGKKLRVDADYFIYNDPKNRDVYTTTYLADNTPTAPAIHTKSYADQKITVYTAKADLSLPFDFANIDIGSKLSFIKNNTPINSYIVQNNIANVDTGNTDHYIYSENTQAVYINASKEMEKWNVELGLRGEYTQTKSDSRTYTQVNTNSYFKLFPTAFITYKKNKDNEFSLTFGRRIERPEYWSSNPFKYYSTPYFYQQGNPFLQPSFTNNIDLVHTYKSIFTTTLNFYQTTSDIDNIIVINPNTNIIASTFSNYINSTGYGITEGINYSHLKWLESNTEVVLYYYKARSSYPGTSPVNEGLSCNFNTNNTLVLNKTRTIMADLMYWYQFPGYNGIVKTNAHYCLELGFKFATPNKQWVFALNFTDIFRSESETTTSVINGVSQFSHGYYDSRGIRMNITWRFGSGKMPERETVLGNEEETKRAK